jgi:hypothetical protein
MEKAWKEEDTWASYFVRAFFDNHDLIALEESNREVYYLKGTEGRTKIQERDVYMVYRLLQLCQIINKRKRVVVIIAWCCTLARNAAFVECRRHWFYS